MSRSLTIPYLQVIQTLSRRRKASIYLVGGFLRDQFLNRSGCDFDFTVSKDAIALARSFGRAIKGAFVLLDEEHPCGRVVKKENGQILTFDFSDFRSSSLEKDLKLRDFTVNTFCLDVGKLDASTNITEELMDLRHGLKDLKTKTIRNRGDLLHQLIID